ncbi:sugar kinase [Actinobacillus succinogenes]|uniref:2-dehydro-3-deoxygluconokinase n=1 Tax=Actinobacillus succinogenes (strain ATCC 55618 / DSM 22257 / CCUG 43843 / 130Z) TaxID=339671 RepID=A6VPD4_ACTSZ|nr:sugar kinase [Actinobacillus succinogenes]ABR74831.1 PfkB domain protein [Actinobacillus succinogenes 130Z]PHI40757.1 sugar kinase [Actinobacillus succinogenes]
MKKIAILGECMIELNGKPFGQMRQTYGGDTLNTATYLARVTRKDQVDISYVSVLGKDNLSLAMLAHWQDDGINTDCVLLDQKRQPGLYLIQLDDKGERTFLYWRSQSAARYLLQHEGYAEVLTKLATVDMIYLSGISLAILPENDRTLLIKQLKNLKKTGVKIAFDSNYRPALWDNLQQTQACYQALLSLVDLALVTFDDEQSLWQDENVQQTISRLAGLGIDTIVVKSGEDGAVFYHNGETQQVVTEIVRQVVDTTSAGDAFNAGFLNGYLQQKSLFESCQRGNKLAGIVIQHKGAIIDKEATKHLIREFN